MTNNAVILFTRIPVAGKTKTRLMPVLTGEECCELQSAFLLDMYSELQKVKSSRDIFVYYAPEGELTQLQTLLSGAEVFFPQTGKDLGEKMYNAFCNVLKMGYSRCVLLGSDLPLLRAKDVDAAFDMLATHDMVLCPTEDGGYYLIGMKEPVSEVFNVTYGKSTVFTESIAQAKRAGKTCAIGARAQDIDEPQDLFNLMDKLKNEDSSVCPNTRIVLENKGRLYGTRKNGKEID
ncbi:MAG: TIGR04282 family arsenosugar biosynthesis glycosyltransferase [Defluviitaleaceae bacterium]|nr:TIGR04282 family arsenosugar biosynthesis glycosyltransferase [Defluviitaleaceae bacterium]